MTVNERNQMEPTRIKPAKPTGKSYLNELGGTGTSIVQGMISEEENPELTGPTGMRTYHKMRTRNAACAALLTVIKLPIEATERYVEPASGEKKDVEIAEFVEQNIMHGLDKTRSELLQEILTKVDFGFSLFEKVYRIDQDGNIALKTLGYRKQETIQYRETSEKTPGVQQMLVEAMADGPNKDKNYLDIPAHKLVRFTYNQEGANYEGRSALRPIYQNYYMMDKLYRYDVIGAERMSMPIPTVRLPEQASDEDKEEAKKIVMNVRIHQQAGVVMPGPKKNGWDFEFVTPDMKSVKDLDKSIAMHKRDIFLSGLAQFLMLGADETGSYALSEDQSSLFLLAITKIAKNVRDVMNNFVIQELVDLNFEVEAYPTLNFQKIGSVEYDKLVKSVTEALTGGAITKDDQIEDFVRKEMGLPPKEETQEEEETDPGKDADSETADDIDEAGSTEEDDADENAANMKKQATAQKKHVCTGDNEFLEFCALFDNQMILKIQNQMDPKDVKKKGLSFNSYEDQARRPLTFAERKVNLNMIKNNIVKFEEILEEQLEDITLTMKVDIMKQVKRAVENNDIKALEFLKPKYKGKLSKMLTDIQKEMFEIGKKAAAAEMGVAVPPTQRELLGALRTNNDAVVDKFMNDVENVTKATVSQVVQKNASITNVTPTEAVNEVGKAIDKTVEKAKASMKTLSITGSVNVGRTSVFERYPEKIYAMQYSAILDDRTTKTCLSLDGRVVEKGSKDYYAYTPPRHYNCRSVRVEILVDEVFKPPVTGIPSSIPANQSLDNFQELKDPILEKGSQAIRVIKDEIKERQEKLEKLRSQDKYPNRQDQHEKAIERLEKSIKNLAEDTAKKALVKQGITIITGTEE